MLWPHPTVWLKAALPALGGAGILFAAFLDSSFLPLPLVTDLLVLEFSIRHPAHMPYYAALAAAGSLAGCICVYALARKGGEAYYRRKLARRNSGESWEGASQPSDNPGAIRAWVQKYPLTAVLVPAIAPFPVPFKPFVIAQGVFKVPFLTFVVGTLAGRGALFFIEGFLATRYGSAANEVLLRQKWLVGGLLILLAVFVLLRQLRATHKGTPRASSL